MKRRRALFQALAFAVSASLVAACGGGGGGGGGSTPPTTAPTSSPTPVPTAPPGTQANFTCPSSDTASSSSVRSVAMGKVARRAVSRSRSTKSSSAYALIAVEYNTSQLTASRKTIAARVSTLQASPVREMAFSHVGRTVQILRVSTAQMATVIKNLQVTTGVRSVAQVQRRAALSVNAPLFTNDPYFTGFAHPVPQATGAAVPNPTYSTPPYYENADVPGQWDMHVIGLEDAFAYKNTGNGSPVSSAYAMGGSSSVKLAIIDTGQDTTHPELQGRITYQRCFITDDNNVQSTSHFTTDPAGHGTDVTGIAAENINNGVGFDGVAGNVSVLGYRVFPKPDSSCDNEANGDNTCDANSVDIADAIEDAIAQHANVISMSLGSCCGADTPPESTAVEDAINAGIIVVAAAGNDNAGGTQGYSPGGTVANSIDAPANNPGVIAVGATSLNDGQPNGAGYTGANKEYIASYSDYAGVNTFGSAASWGISAPGGDPSAQDTNGATTDYLHWISNIWTSTPYDANDAANCNGDYPSETGTGDCRVLIAGTSMSTPHVAGAAALILSVSGATYASPSKMYTLLCATADNLNDPHQGCGRLNVYRAMAKALGDPNLP